MDLSEVTSIVEGIPHMPVSRGREIYEFVRRQRFESILELGFAHGVSSCYIAAALQANGTGMLTTIDREAVRELEPDIETLLDKTDLTRWVQPIHAPSCYTWELMRMLEETPAGQWRFDFAFIDGAHSWLVDGFAFLLVDRLLKPGGWVLFDDLAWTFGTSPTLRDTDMVRAMPAQERDTPQVGKVFDLLVRTHPSYTSFRSDGWWGWARKSPQ